MTMSTNATVQEAYSSYAANQTKASSKTSDYGNTIGNPELSEKAQQYYEQLKEKYKGYNFVLVSDDQASTAMQQASRFASAGKTTVLIDVSKIEAMASDESVRAKYEGILDTADTQLDSLKSSLDQKGIQTDGYGIQVNDDGTLSFFAVLKQASAAQRERIEAAREEAKEEKKAEEKKAEKEEFEERIKVLSASSIDELLQKIDDFSQDSKLNSIRTEQEMMLGQHIDFKG